MKKSRLLSAFAITLAGSTFLSFSVEAGKFDPLAPIVNLLMGAKESPPTDKKYLAKNIIFRANPQTISANKQTGSLLSFLSVPDAHANTPVVDTETKIYADNVIFEQNQTSNIESNNVQEALEEITLLFSNVIIGEWQIENKNLTLNDIDSNYLSNGGKLKVNGDLTFDVTEGSFAAVGIGVSDERACGSHVKESMSYEVITDEALQFSYTRTYVDEGMGGGPTYIDGDHSWIPQVLSLKQNKIILLGGGGCSGGSGQKLSILTRIL